MKSKMVFLIIFCIIVAACVVSTVIIRESSNSFSESEIELIAKKVDLTDEVQRETLEDLKMWEPDMHDFKNKVVVRYEYTLCNNSGRNISQVEQYIDFELFEEKSIEHTGREDIVEGVVDIDSGKQFPYIMTYLVPKDLSEKEIDKVLSKAVKQISYSIKNKQYITSFR